MRLIDADALVKEISVSHTMTDDCGIKTGYEISMRLVEDAPTIEPRPRGRWIPVDSYSAFGGDEATWMAHGNPIAFYCCSECKEQAYAGEDGESLLTDFCPHCGADMRQREEDHT